MRIGINFQAVEARISGVEYYALGMIGALIRARAGHEYVVFTNNAARLREYVPKYNGLTVRENARIRTRWERIAWEHGVLPGAARREGVEVLHCPSYICPLLGEGIPYVATIHDTIAIDHPGWCRWSNAWYYNFSLPRTVRRARRIVAVSRRTAEDVARNFPAAAVKTRVIYPGVDEIFNPTSEAGQHAEARRRYKLPERYILFVGNREPKKNLETLLSAYLRLRRRGFGCRLVITGGRCWGPTGAWRGMLGQFQENEVICTGYVRRADLPALYQMAEVFVFPSWYEGFGFPPLEAMACGTPVVASGGGALAETLTDAASLIDPSDAQDLAEAIERMTTDAIWRQEHIQRGWERSRQFSWERAAAQLLSVYAEARDEMA